MNLEVAFASSQELLVKFYPILNFECATMIPGETAWWCRIRKSSLTAWHREANVTVTILQCLGLFLRDIRLVEIDEAYLFALFAKSV